MGALKSYKCTQSEEITKFVSCSTVMKLSYWEKFLKESPDAADHIDFLRSQVVKFNTCANTLKGRKIAFDDLHFAEEGDIDVLRCCGNWLTSAGRVCLS